MNQQFLLAILPLIIGLVNPQGLTRLAVRKQFNKNDFVFDFNKAKVVVKGGESSTIKPLTVDQLPSLQGEGISYVLFDFEPCAANLPHIHPRATELLFVISGKLQVAFSEENGGRGAFVNNLKAGQAAVFPKGLVHFEQNLSCERTKYIAALNSEDPGVVTVSKRTFEFPDEVLQTTFILSKKEIDDLRKKLPDSPASGVQECLKRCNIKY
jgi:oxalate decarboxylase/phosphoglucose isomerase-like protein (cupin superfamily)